MDRRHFLSCHCNRQIGLADSGAEVAQSKAIEEVGGAEHPTSLQLSSSCWRVALLKNVRQLMKKRNLQVKIDRRWPRPRPPAFVSRLSTDNDDA